MIIKVDRLLSENVKNPNTDKVTTGVLESFSRMVLDDKSLPVVFGSESSDTRIIDRLVISPIDAIGIVDWITSTSVILNIQNDCINNNRVCDLINNPDKYCAEFICITDKEQNVRDILKVQLLLKTQSFTYCRQNLR